MVRTHTYKYIPNASLNCIIVHTQSKQRQQIVSESGQYHQIIVIVCRCEQIHQNIHQVLFLYEKYKNILILHIHAS